MGFEGCGECMGDAEDLGGDLGDWTVTFGGDLVGDLVCSVVGGVTERVVLTFVVVISHRQAVMLGVLGGGTGR